MTSEARLVDDGAGLKPDGDGWYVVNAREVRWFGTDADRFTFFEADDDWPDLGFNVSVLEPGAAMARYHAESNREVFLVLSGEPLLLVEGEERPLKPWDFVHCPPWTAHVLVGAGAGLSVVVAASPRARPGGFRYLAADVAKKHGAAPPRDTEDAAEAYAGTEPLSFRRYRPGDLPG